MAAQMSTGCRQKSSEASQKCLVPGATSHSNKAVAAAAHSRLELPKAGIWATPDGVVHLILPEVDDRHQGSPRL